MKSKHKLYYKNTSSSDKQECYRSIGKIYNALYKKMLQLAEHLVSKKIDSPESVGYAAVHLLREVFHGLSKTGFLSEEDLIVLGSVLDCNAGELECSMIKGMNRPSQKSLQAGETLYTMKCLCQDIFQAIQKSGKSIKQKKKIEKALQDIFLQEQRKDVQSFYTTTTNVINRLAKNCFKLTCKSQLLSD